MGMMFGPGKNFQLRTNDGRNYLDHGGRASISGTISLYIEYPGDSGMALGGVQALGVELGREPTWRMIGSDLNHKSCSIHLR
jgi:hypothetical protein